MALNASRRRAIGLALWLLVVAASGNAVRAQTDNGNANPNTTDSQQQPVDPNKYRVDQTLYGAAAFSPINEDIDQNGLRIAPVIGLHEVYSSNVIGTGASQPDLITQVTPGFKLHEKSPGSLVDIQYTSIFDHFEQSISQDRVDQNLYGAARLSPIADYLDVKMDTYVTQTGGRANSPDFTGLIVPTDDRVLLYLGSLEPRFQARFNEIASVDAYYRIKSANASDEGTSAGGRHSLSTDSLNQEVELVLATGQILGQLGSQIKLNHSVGTGSGTNNQSTGDNDVLKIQYHFNHAYSVEGAVGYQKIHYNASIAAGAYNSEGLIWSLGGRATPNPDSIVYVTYGYREGGYVPTVEITYALGPRTAVTANYDVNVQNQLQSTLANLQYLTFDINGRPIDKRTGLPFVANNSVFGEQNVLFRDKLGTITLSHQFMRSGLTFTATYENRSSVTGFATRDTSIGAQVQFARDLTPNVNCTIDAGFTDHRTSGAVANGPEHARLFNADFSLYYHLSEATSFVLTGTYVHKSSNIAKSTFTTEQFLVGMNRDF
jgi:hypothetical protein